MNIAIELAGRTLRVGLLLPETAARFGAYRLPGDCAGSVVRLGAEDLHRPPLSGPDVPLTDFAEFVLLMPLASRALLGQDAALVHGVGFLWRGKAWLITAPSGVGKTTQLNHWRRQWPEELELINGDKCVLELGEDGRFWLHPCPWTGKEGDAGTACAPLGGVILLEQAGENSIGRLAPQDAALRMLQAFILNYDTEEEARSAAAMTERLLRSVPVWLLRNRGDAASSALIRETIVKWEEDARETV